MEPKHELKQDTRKLAIILNRCKSNHFSGGDSPVKLNDKFEGMPSPDIVQSRLDILCHAFPNKSRLGLQDTLRRCNFDTQVTIAMLRGNIKSIQAKDPLNSDTDDSDVEIVDVISKSQIEENKKQDIKHIEPKKAFNSPNSFAYYTNRPLTFAEAKSSPIQRNTIVTNVNPSKTSEATSILKRFSHLPAGCVDKTLKPSTSTALRNPNWLTNTMQANENRIKSPFLDPKSHLPTAGGTLMPVTIKSGGYNQGYLSSKSKLKKECTFQSSNYLSTKEYHQSNKYKDNNAKMMNMPKKDAGENEKECTLQFSNELSTKEYNLWSKYNDNNAKMMYVSKMNAGENPFSKHLDRKTDNNINSFPSNNGQAWHSANLSPYILNAKGDSSGNPLLTNEASSNDLTGYTVQSHMLCLMKESRILDPKKYYEKMYPIVAHDKWVLRFLVAIRQLTTISCILDVDYSKSVGNILRAIEIEKVCYWLEKGQEDDTIKMLTATCASKNILLVPDEKNYYNFAVDKEGHAANKEHSYEIINGHFQNNTKPLLRQLHRISAELNEWMCAPKKYDAKLDNRRTRCCIDCAKLDFQIYGETDIADTVFDSVQLENALKHVPALSVEDLEYNVENFDEIKFLRAFENVRRIQSYWTTGENVKPWQILGNKIQFRTILEGISTNQDASAQEKCRIVVNAVTDKKDTTKCAIIVNDAIIDQPDVKHTSNEQNRLQLPDNDIQLRSSERRVRKRPVRYTECVTDDDDDILTEHDKRTKLEKQPNVGRTKKRACIRNDVDDTLRDSSNHIDNFQQNGTKEDESHSEGENTSTSEKNQEEKVKIVTSLTNIQQGVPMAAFDIDFQLYFHSLQGLSKGKKGNSILKGALKMLSVKDAATRDGKMLISFTQFIHFMTVNKMEKESNVNPFEPNVEDALEFLQLLYDANEDQSTINSCRNGIRRVMLWSNDCEMNDFLQRSEKMGPATLLEDIKAIEKYKHLAQICPLHIKMCLQLDCSAVNSKTELLQGLYQFIRWCFQKQIYNPYLASISQISLFLIETYLHLSNTSAIYPIYPVLRNVICALDCYHSSNFIKSVKPGSYEAIRYFLDCVKSSDHLQINKIGTYLDCQRGIYAILPPFKYVSYVKNHQNRDHFWKEAKIIEIFRFLFGDLPNHFDPIENGPKMSLTQGSIAIGVTQEMMMVGYAKFRATNLQSESRQLQILDEVNCSNENKAGVISRFWELPHTLKVIRKIRKRSMSISEGAFKLGVSRNEMKTRVGSLDSKKLEIIKEKPKPKENALQIQLKNFNDDDDLSEYEKIRKKNIADRLAIFNQLNLGDQEECAAKKLGGKKCEVESIKPRARSTRIQKNKMKQESEKALKENEDDCVYPWKRGKEKSLIVPPIPIPLDETTAMHLSWEYSRKFLCHVQQELSYDPEDLPILFKSPSRNMWNNENVASGKDTDNENHNFYNHDLTLHSVCDSLTPYPISAAAIHPKKELSLTCVGDITGALGIWLPGDKKNLYEDEAPIGKHCLFKPHSEKINYICFNMANNALVVTCSKDGFIRSIDLGQGYQMLDLVYNWSNHTTDFERKSVHSCLSVSLNEYLISKEESNFQDIVLLYDARQKNVALNLKADVHLSMSPRVSLNPSDMVTIAVLGEDCVILGDIRMPYSSDNARFFSKVPCTEPTLADFSHNSCNELLVCGKYDDQVGVTAKIYSTNNIHNLTENPTRVIEDLSEFDAPSINVQGNYSIKKVFQKNTLPNYMCSNQAVWHPDVAGSIVVSKRIQIGTTKNKTFYRSMLQHQLQVISSSGDSTGCSSFDEVPFECHQLISSSGGLGLINSRIDGVVSLFQ